MQQMGVFLAARKINLEVMSMPDAEGILEARDIVELPKESPARRRGKTIKGSEHMDWGMRNRLSQLIKKDGHCFFMPIDHGYF